MVAAEQHVDCPPDQRKWLEVTPDQAATMRPHAYCIICGRVKNLDGPRAKSLGFYLSGLAALKEYLERSARFGKMTQTQSRLITKALERLEQFEDPYGLGLEVQVHLYIDVVRSVRPDLDDDLVLRLLPRMKRKPRKPLIERMANTSVD